MDTKAQAKTNASIQRLKIIHQLISNITNEIKTKRSLESDCFLENNIRRLEGQKQTLLIQKSLLTREINTRTS